MKISLLEMLNSAALPAIDPERRRKALSDLEGPLEPMFYAKQPTSILVCDGLPAMGVKPKKVSLAEFCAQRKFSWTGAPLIHQKRRQHLLEQPTQVCLETHSLQHWFHGFDDYVVVDLDCNHSKSLTAESKQGLNIKVGEGVFYYSRQNKPLNAGVCVGNYEGVLRSRAEGNEFHPYGFVAAQDDEPTNLFARFYGTGFYHADSHGDYTRFIQHAPTEAELEEIKMPDHLKILACTANLVPNCGINTPIPTMSFVTRRVIGLNGQREQFFYSYEKYWADMELRNPGSGVYALFDIDGEIIGTVDAKKQFTPNENYRWEGKKPALRCDSGADQGAIDQLQKSTAVNKDCRPIFLENIRFIVNFHANRKKTDGSNFYSKDECNYIKKMQRICENSDPEFVLYKIDDVREALSKKNMLLALSLELCAHMNYYQMNRNLIAAQPKKPVQKTFVEEIGKRTKSAEPIDQQAMTAVWKSLKQATGEGRWSVDKQQNLCLVGDMDKLESISQYLAKKSVKCLIEPFPQPPTFCLRVPATQLINKVLESMQSVTSPSVEKTFENKGMN